MKDTDVPSGYLLDYSDYRRIKAMEYIEDGHGPPSLDDDYRGRNRQAYEWNNRHYFGAKGECPFCSVAMPIALARPGYIEKNTVWACQHCGWWELERVLSAGGVENEVAFSAVHYQACVKKFEVSSSLAPTEALIDHLRKRPNSFYALNKRKMEEIVQVIFSEFYQCEVLHCGKSHDGGVDLIMINAEQPTMIQVKCRESSSAVEPISQIREFLGAMWAKQSTRGIYVSTADHYSAISVRTIGEMVASGVLSYFDLVDFTKLKSLLNSTASPKERIWTRLLEMDYIDGEIG